MTDVIASNDAGIGSIVKNAYTKDVFNYSGVATRKQYWTITVLYVIYAFLVNLWAFWIISNVSDPSTVSTGIKIAFVILAILGIYLFLVQLSISVRRLHDMGFSGWFAILLLVPYINIAFAIVLGVVPTKSENNAYRS
ncbi:MAG: DUF805 domain-containing protein [Neisseriaceae bacterium]|nr:DUF805 domain-containing protein [Neisseriaceae bacterium]